MLLLVLLSLPGGSEGTGSLIVTAPAELTAEMLLVYLAGVSETAAVDLYF